MLLIDSNRVNKNYSRRSLYVIMKKATNMLYHFDFIYRRSDCYAIEQKHFKNGVLVRKILEEKEKQLSEEAYDSKSSKDYEVSRSKPQTFIDRLYKNPELFSREQIADEVNIMFLAVFIQVKKLLSLELIGNKFS